MQLSHQQHLRKRKKIHESRIERTAASPDNCTSIETDSLGDIIDAEIRNEDTNLAIIAATNRISDLDEAALRRFDCKV
jgi:SpoVK/Ycf46/Vps4 family AAA+-type ATPase